MQIKILSGIYSDNAGNFIPSYPVNMEPFFESTGISDGFLRPACGLMKNGEGPGVDRGGINWNGACYRVMGTKLVSVGSNGAVTALGDVGGTLGEAVRMDYGFDRLAIASGGRLYYWDGAALTQVTDPDLGSVVDLVWVDGYYMTTDGVSLVVTEINNPTQVNPLKYGSSEIDPDRVLALLKVRGEVHALNRHTIEVFKNVGGDFFPFQRIEGAQIQKGAVGTHACCAYADVIAFVGSGRNESLAVYLAENSNTVKISTLEIDRALAGYTEEQLSLVMVEARNDKSGNHLYVHLPDRTFVYDAAASAIAKSHVWFVLTSSIVGFSQYRGRNMVWCYGLWLVGDPQSSSVGFMTDDSGEHWGQAVRWEFGTMIVYNESRGAAFRRVELVALAGRNAVGTTPTISTSYSVDGLSWSQDRQISAGPTGNTQKRLVWFQNGHMRNWRIQRFRGDSQSRLSFARLEAQLDALLV